MPAHLPSPCRTAARALAALLLVAGGVWFTTDLPAQDPAKAPPPRKRPVEEEEDAPAKAPPAKAAPKEGEDDSAPKAKDGKKKREEEEDAAPKTHKVIPTDDDDTPARAATSAPAVTGGFNLAELARQTKDRRVANLYKRLAVPHDLLTIGGSNPRDERVQPLPTYIADDPKAYVRRGGIKVVPLDAEGKPGKEHGLSENLRSVRHYEQILMAEADNFLAEQARARTELTRQQQLTVAENLLTAAARFYESARASEKRKGDEWQDAVEVPLRNRLLDIRLEQLKALTDGGQWDEAVKLTGLLAREYRKPDEQKRIAKPLLDFLEASLRSGIESEEGTSIAIRRLHELQDQFPDRNVLESTTNELHRHAEELAKQAKAFEKEQKFDKALEAIGQAVELAPGDTKLRTYQRDLMKQHRILRVGVRSLPQFMSPARARTDSELRAVELMFESLVKPRVDAHGDARFVPGLAEGPPQVEALGRRFTLPKNAYWSNGQPLSAGDIRHTIELLKESKGDPRFAARARMLEGVRGGADPYRVTLLMLRGCIDPLALMSFKVLPDNLDVDSEAFAQDPVGSGPYEYNGKTVSEASRQCKCFTYNSHYGTARQGKAGLPRIHEIRFFTYKPYDGKGNPTEEFDRPGGNAPLDMILDLPPEHAVAIAKKAGTKIRLCRPNVNATVNRRVYFLAINCAAGPLGDHEQGADIRRALALAINREKILTDCFRPPAAPDTQAILGKLHAALNGPFPAGSWACNPKVGPLRVKNSLDLFDEQGATALYRTATGKLGNRASGRTYKLKFPDDDPAVQQAMEAIRQQVGTIGFNVELVPTNRLKLYDEVETGEYELAYCHYDYPDETYSVAPLVTARSNADGTSNPFHCADLTKVESLLQNARTYREFAKVKEDTWNVHYELYTAMPFIPLWQLDPIAAVHNSVESPWFDPILVFNDIERWVAKPR